jgi:hypothetical protein
MSVVQAACSPGEWFKSEQCWQELRAASAKWIITKQVSKELLSVGEEYTDVSDEVQSNVARCLEVKAETWFQVQLWGREAGQLQAWQIGIANTLSGYAAQGWARKSSEKQAKHAVAILELFERAHSTG